MTARKLYESNLANPSDIGGHMAVLLSLGLECEHITEFGVRSGISTSCWLNAAPHSLRCYDIAVPGELDLFKAIADAERIDFTFTQADTSTLPDIEQTELLFLDTLHTSPQLAAELRHEARVARYIVLHDTEANGWAGEGGEDGLKKALIDFLLDHTDWRIHEHHKHCNGLTVLEKD